MKINYLCYFPILNKIMLFVSLQGFHKEFTTLRALITHHSVMKESLPVALALPRPQNVHRKCKNIDDYDTYARLKDLQSIFSDLDITS
jgi:hypothetical protein